MHVCCARAALIVAGHHAGFFFSRQGPIHADSLRIVVKGGQGGDGCVAFAREKFKPYGPPSGSSGGDGGAILIQASSSVASLARLPGQSIAERGAHGSGDWQPGKQGQSKTLQVPVGTVVRVVPVRPSEEAEVHRAHYEKLLRRKYRSAFMRQRRLRFAHVTDDQEELSFTPDDLRAQRDVMWRHYAGAIGHNVPLHEKTDDQIVAEVEDDDKFPAERTEERRAEQEDLSDAESDIRGLGRSFREAERRLAFLLLDQSYAEQTASSSSPSNVDGSIARESGQEWTIDLDKETITPLPLVIGGQGGQGNAFFASASNRSPTLAVRGGPGREAIVHLEWKFKGDVGLIGLPNAGKSTFLKAVSATGDDVRVAGYAFTTLTPNVGVVRLGAQGLIGTNDGPVEESVSRTEALSAQEGQQPAHSRDRFGTDESARFILQDLPGLVRGASYNRGLGHDFLKHVERCLALYYVVDVSDAAKTPWQDVQLVYKELEAYRTGLSGKVQGIIANKCDAIDVQRQQQEPEEEEHRHDATAAAAGHQDEVIDGRQKLQILRGEAAKLHGRAVPVWNVSAKYRLGVERTARAMARVVKAQKLKDREALQEEGKQ